MAPPLADARHWMQDGTELVVDLVADLVEPEFMADSLLPGWTRKHLVAHLAANADALRNLAHWAATGQRTPMYASPAQRLADIEHGGQLPASELTSWLHRSVSSLESALSELGSEQWTNEVMTAQGRTILATEIPWLRAREVYVHAVDADRGTGFGDLPEGFLAILVDDIVAKRTGPIGDDIALELVATDLDRRWVLPGIGQGTTLRAPLAELTAYLAGRPHRLVDAPPLSPWL
jgi:maleylpyruvate isomerase